MEKKRDVVRISTKRLHLLLTTKLVEMILNYKSNKRRSKNSGESSEPLVNQVDKFLKTYSQAADSHAYLNQPSGEHEREEYKRLTPFMAACLVKNVDVAKLLLKNGARLMQVGNSVGMELSYAMLNLKSLNSRERKCRDELIDLIIDIMESDEKIKENYRSYVFPFTCIVTEGDLNSLETLIKRGILDQPVRRVMGLEVALKLFIRTRDNNEAIVKRLLELTPDVNVVSPTNSTPLMCIDDAQLFDLLVERGALINFRNRKGHTALMMNTHESRETILLKLIKAGADFTACDDEGKTALEYSHSIGAFTCLCLCHLIRIYEFFHNLTSDEIRSKCQSAVEAEFEHAKKIVATKHRRLTEKNTELDGDGDDDDEAEKQLRSLRNRHVNYPIAYSDLYAIRRLFDCLQRLPYLINDHDIHEQFYFLPYFMSSHFIRKLFNDVVNFLVESKLTLNGQPLGDVKCRVINEGTDLEREEFGEFMKLVNENRRIALKFHLNIQSHPLAIKVFNAILPANYKTSMESEEFEQTLEAHLNSQRNNVLLDVIENTFDKKIN